jgi:hypothetical protein
MKDVFCRFDPSLYNQTQAGQICRIDQIRIEIGQNGGRAEQIKASRRPIRMERVVGSYFITDLPC